MAVTLERIKEGIRRANAAGDVETVRKLGAAYRQLQGQAAEPTDHPAFAGASAASGKLSGKVADLPSHRPTLGDEVLSFGRGVIEGVPIAGPALADARRALDANIMSALHGGETGDYQDQFKAADEELRSKTGGARTAGNVTGAIAALAPLGATAVGGRLLGTTGTLGQRVLTGGISSGAISAADTAARGGSQDDIVGAGGIGAAIGGAIPFVGAGVRRILSPLPAAASKTAAADILKKEGVELTAGQATGSKGLQYREAELGGATAEGFAERQADQFTAAALRRAGIDASRATPDVMDAGFDAIGQQFDELASRNAIGQDRNLLNDISAIWRDYSGVVSQSNRAPVVENMIRDIVTEFQKGAITGSFYQSIRSRIDRLARGSRDSDLAGTLRDLKGALDDAMERSIAQSNPTDLGAWQEARRLYRNILVVEDAVARAGERAADGIITPAALKSAAMRKGKRAFIRGNSEFTDLANAGVSTMTPLPNSGTPGRLSAKLFVPAGAATGAAIGHAILPGVGAIPGAAAGAALPWMAGKAMLSGVGRRYLGNQLATGPAGRAPLPPVVAALLGQPD